MNRIVLISMTLIAAMADASDPRLGGPALGWVLTDSGLSAVYGIPGAAVMGPTLGLGARVLRSAVANEAGLAVAALEDGRLVLVRGSDALDIEGVIPEPTRIAVSPLGRAAVLYSEPERTLQIITGLSGAPRAAKPVAFGWPAGALAISDGGRALIAADGALWSASPGRMATHVLLAPGITAIAFFPSTSAYAFADGATIWTNRRGQIEAAAEVSGAIALAATAGTLYAATARTVARIDLRTGERTGASCPCEVTGLQRMRGGSVFQVNFGDKAPVYLYDGASPQPRFVFVPAAPAGFKGGAE